MMHISISLNVLRNLCFQNHKSICLEISDSSSSIYCLCGFLEISSPLSLKRGQGENVIGIDGLGGPSGTEGCLSSQLFP